MRLPGVLCSLLLLAFASAHLSAQAVVSTHSGIVNYSEGAVFLDDAPLNQQFGTFASVKDGSTLRTEKGRAEILLTPGVFLRIDENSAIRMISSVLAATRVEFLRGAAILDSNDAASGNPCVLVYKTYQLRFPKPGVYRLSSEPAVFQTYTGEAEIQTAGEPPKTIDESNQFFFGIGMETKKYGDGAVDAFSEWARNRAETIAADNRVGSQSTTNPDAGDAANSPFTLPSSPGPGLGIGQAGIGQPNYSYYDPPMWAGNGFLGPWGPYNGFFNPPLVIYVFPRFYGRNPRNPIYRNPIYRTAPRRPGYPVVPPLRTGYPSVNSFRPATIPLRSTNNYTRPSLGHIGVAGPRVVSPVAVRPMGPPRR